MSFGLAYNGSVIHRLSFGDESGLYCVAPSYMDRCQVSDEYKIGFTGTSRAGSYSGSMARRLSAYATAFIEFRIPMIITYSRRSEDSEYTAQKSHNDSNRAERECFAFLTREGGTRKSHVSGNPSEWFVNVDKTLLRKAFDHMTDVQTPGILGPKPQPTGAWWFDEKVELSKENLNIDPWSEWQPIPARDDRERRDLERRLEKAKKDRQERKTLPKDRFLVRDLEAQLEAMLNPGVVRLDDDALIDIEQFDFEPNVRSGVRGPSLSKRALPKVRETIERPTQNTDVVTFEDDAPDDMTSTSTFELFDSATGERAPMTRARPLQRFYNTRSTVRQLRPRR
jgi:hypothetical protein